MKYLKIIFLVLAIVCFIEIYYMHRMLSFIDYPYLYAGGLFLALSAYIYTKKRK
tara:strand:- start:657 stop:818 length:162 start_codon:yes stop_codon:yes gene_type:complete